VRVGPGKPAGELFRRYWQPVLLSSELEENDGPPVRVRHLGEDLLAFRDTAGKIGLVDAYCPHRRAPLFFGRNEDCGIRCVYHGWKFDASGSCVDMPSEPTDSSFKNKVRITSYPTYEKGGLIWAYLGPADKKPAPPDFEWMRTPARLRGVSKTLEHCNYLQALEGGLDTSHSSFVHNNKIGDTQQLRNRDRSPRIDIETTDYGYAYTSTRNAGDGKRYVRVYHYILPNFQMRGQFTMVPGSSIPSISGHIWVPIDDEHTFVYNWLTGIDNDSPFTQEYYEGFESFTGRGHDDVVPGTFRLKKNLSNDYMIDRQLQKTQTYSGIVGLNTQDFALQEGMGPIVDRSQEHLGTSDRAIISMRKLMLEATHAVEKGQAPRGTDPKTYAKVRPYDNFIEGDAPWKEAFARDVVAKW
jgi:phthalate 4,5-dioxygenase oxygenase subunit